MSLCRSATWSTTTSSGAASYVHHLALAGYEGISGILEGLPFLDIEEGLVYHDASAVDFPCPDIASIEESFTFPRHYDTARNERNGRAVIKFWVQQHDGSTCILPTVW